MMSWSLVLGLAGCSGDDARKTVVVGSSADLTGIFESFGKGAVFGMQAAVADINALGGVDVADEGGKLKLELKLFDNASDPIKAQEGAESLIVHDQVDILISPGPPSMNIPIASVAEQYKVPHLVSSGPLEPWLGQRMQANPPWEQSWMAGFAIIIPPAADDFRSGKPGYTIQDTWLDALSVNADKTSKKVGVFAADDSDGRGWYSLFPDVLKTNGYDVVGSDQNLGLVPLDGTDYSDLIKRWKDNGVEIIWGNSPSPHFQAMWAQAHALDFKPKIVSIGRGALFWQDVSQWGDDLPWGVGAEGVWSPKFPASEAPGIGNTTPQSLGERWTAAKHEPVNPLIGSGYAAVQVLVDAIRRAGSLDRQKINTAIGQTDLQTIEHRVKFDLNEHFSRGPIFFGQWIKTEDESGWDIPITFSKHSWLPAETDRAMFPVP
jgi:ABC-type branched-subunit amino acid transport system substrate-binding protein